MRMITGVVLGILPLSALAAGDAPFCLVNNSGQANCFYYSADACQTAQRSLGGLCSANSQRSQHQSYYDVAQGMQYPDIAGSFQRGVAEGQRLKLEKERHEAEMRLLEAQLAQVQQQPKPVTVQAGAAQAAALEKVGDPNGRDLGEAAVYAAGLHRACGYAQAAAGPAQGRLNADELMLASVCITYAKGALDAAAIANGLSPDGGATAFCRPRIDKPSTLASAIVTAGKEAPGLIGKEVPASVLLWAALASVSSCPVRVK